MKLIASRDRKKRRKTNKMELFETSPTEGVSLKGTLTTFVQTPRWQLPVACVRWAWFLVGPTWLPTSFATLLLPSSHSRTFPCLAPPVRMMCLGEQARCQAGQLPRVLLSLEKTLVFGISDSLFKSTLDVSVRLVGLSAKC